MATLLKAFDDRDEAHAHLATVRAEQGDGATAECREDQNDPERPFQVWDGPGPGDPAAPAATPAKTRTRRKA